jgi:soluble lytic murein transglycosylase
MTQAHSSLALGAELSYRMPIRCKAGLKKSSEFLNTDLFFRSLSGKITVHPIQTRTPANMSKILSHLVCALTRYVGPFAFVTSVLVTAHSAPARATRPLIESSNSLDEAQWMPVDLEEVEKKKTLGLQDEDNATRTLVIQQALEYSQYRASRSLGAKLVFLSACGRAPQNPFCKMEIQRQNRKLMGDGTSTGGRLAHSLVKQMGDEFKAAQLDHLLLYSYPTLSKALGQFNEYTPLIAIAEKTLATTDCQVADLAVALGAKAEEFFPAQNYVDLTKKLYKKSAECSENAASMKARYRLALLEIWQNKCQGVDGYLAAVEKNPEASMFHSRAKYWRNYCAKESGKESVRLEARESLWRDFPLSFANLAVNGADTRIGNLLDANQASKVVMRSVIRPDLNSSVRAIEALIQTGNLEIAGDLTNQLANDLSSTEPELRLYVASLMNRIDNTIVRFKILTQLFQDAPRMMTAQTLKLFFPLGYYEILKRKAGGLDPLLLLSLIRQESAFNHMARSAVGARGLMQVMPATARSIASVSATRLYDPQVNITVGTRFFTTSLEHYNGDVELTLAAYNAGVMKVDQWVKRYPIENKVLFMDLIPFKETREYVATIMRNYFWYMKLYKNDPGAHDAKTAAGNSGSPLTTKNTRKAASLEAPIRQKLPQSLAILKTPAEGIE